MTVPNLPTYKWVLRINIFYLISHGCKMIIYILNVLELEISWLIYDVSKSTELE